MNKLRLLALASLLSFAGIISTKDAKSMQKRSYGPQVATGTSSLATAQYTKPITPAQVNNTGGYQIKMPGYYFLTEDLMFYPKNFIDNKVRLPQPATIYISVDNVVLDLNNKTITHLDSKTWAQSSTTGLYGGKALENESGGSGDNIAAIQIAPGVRNVTIKNGTLNYILGNGILVEAASSGGNTSNIAIDGINVINCGREGILVGAAATKTFDVTISNSSVSQCSGSIQKGNLGTARADANLVGTGNAVGISLVNVSNGAIANTSASNNQIDTTQAQTATLSTNANFAMGLKLDTCDNLSIENSVFNNQIGPCAYGMHLTSCNNIYTKNILANNNVIAPLLADPGTDYSAAAGDCGDNTVAGVSMQDCEFCIFEDSVANNNRAYYRGAGEGDVSADEIATKHGAGFLLTPKTPGASPYGVNNYNRFVRCQAHSNKGSRALAADTVYTAEGDSDADNALAQGNWVDIRFGAGFLSIGADTDTDAGTVTTSDAHHGEAGDAMGTGNVFLECRASGNWAYEGQVDRDTKGVGIGLLFENASTVRNCQLISNGVVNLVSSAHSKIMGAGLYLGPRGYASDKPLDATYKESYTRNILIDGNWFVANTWYGLYDDAFDCQSLIMNNFAFRNGSENGTHIEGHHDQDDINYHVQYGQSDENLPSAQATIGDFGPLTVAHAYANVDFSVLATSTDVGDEAAGSPHTSDAGDHPASA